MPHREASSLAERHIIANRTLRILDCHLADVGNLLTWNGHLQRRYLAFLRPSTHCGADLRTLPSRPLSSADEFQSLFCD